MYDGRVRPGLIVSNNNDEGRWLVWTVWPLGDMITHSAHPSDTTDAEQIENNGLPTSYYNHPVVESSDEDVLPVGLYMDGVPYSLTNSVVGVWFINLIN